MYVSLLQTYTLIHALVASFMAISSYPLDFPLFRSIITISGSITVRLTEIPLVSLSKFSGLHLVHETITKNLNIGTFVREWTVDMNNTTPLIEIANSYLTPGPLNLCGNYYVIKCVGSSIMEWGFHSVISILLFLVLL
jgi:hypothetical protein